MPPKAPKKKVAEIPTMKTVQATTPGQGINNNRASAARGQEEPNPAWIPSWLLFVAVFIVAAVLVFLSVNGVWGGKSTPAPIISFDAEAGEKYTASKKIVYSAPGAAAEIRSIAEARSERHPIVNYGSARIFLRVLLLDATPKLIEDFLSQLQSYNGGGANNLKRCVRFIGAAEHSSEKALAQLFHPHTDRDAGCRDAIIVDPDVSKAPDAYRIGTYKGLMEGEGYIYRDDLPGVSDRELSSTASKVMFVVAVPPGTNLNTLWDNRVVQMFTHRLSLERA